MPMPLRFEKFNGFASVFLSTGSDCGLVVNPAVRDGI